ncbi:MAG: tannase/feruloyl esterase family alpha/beta hydrolase [Acidobacteria bacterium]|nr:tannase/feruloyl esterase family alpha/beta hydrolase [Acidobacteriota bacterium]
MSKETSGAARCEQLSRLELPSTTITGAQLVPQGGFNGPAAPFTGRDLSPFYKNLPPFCRISAEAKPSRDSQIKIEVWMPAAGWNGKLQAIGNGGFAGMVDYFQLGAAMSKGYAVTATDTGHTGSPVDATWALGHPEKVVDFGHRGIHEMTRVAKSVVEAFYGKPQTRSYFAGCSDGGREALMEAQRYPADYDGILAGAPANNWTALLSAAVADTQALTLDPASFIDRSQIPVISHAVQAACDELDGLRDGILNDPRQCHFDPATIQCKTGQAPDKCLTSQQATALRKIYDGLRDSEGHLLYPGFLPGAEEGDGGWATWITGSAPRQSLLALFGTGYFSNMVYEKPDWDYRTFRVESGIKAAQEKTAAALNATDPDLSAFRAHGGKLVVYHGWEDPAIPAIASIDYYQSVVAKLGQPAADSFLRLYMVPGMQHCADGPGADSFGQVGKWAATDPQHSIRVALEQWVEGKAVPATLIAGKYAGDGYSLQETSPTMTRPLCPYPQVSRYRNGDSNLAASFTCAATGEK